MVDMRIVIISQYWNQIEISNGITSVVISIYSECYTYLQFIKAVDSERSKVLTLISMINVVFNTQPSNYLVFQLIK